MNDSRPTGAGARTSYSESVVSADGTMTRREARQIGQRRRWLSSPTQVTAGMLVLSAGVGCLAFAALGNRPAPQASNVIAVEKTQEPTLAPPVEPTTTLDAAATSAEPTKEPKAKASAEPEPKQKTAEPKESKEPGADSQPAKQKTAEPAAKEPAAKPKAADPSVNLAASRGVQESSHTQDYVAGNVTDGDVYSYWEATEGFPQTLTIDLGKQQTVGRFVLSLPPVADWNSRAQTISFAGSKNGSSYNRIKAPAGYTFDANSGSANTVSISTAQTRVRYLKLTFSANTGWPNAQLSELRVHSS
ncbi:discoidin domain-containing protein [Kineosporia babensis]|uniref:Discoidin domain-containing protein n=1 Tax=Kineosporia babensis TaxID=499548 RepID=A0A9X1NBL7_9ACTN|nr:discoidin domain-containing protein [Kineosporia babensis]MCD5310296.1 discoidin domain-containing protein [Kineosporia babensis]